MMKPIVFQSLPKWDGTYNSTALTVSTLLSKERKVFFIEHPYSWIDWMKKRNDSKIQRRLHSTYEKPFEEYPNFIVIHPPLTPPINALPEGVGYQVLQKQYIKKLWKRVDSVLEEFDVKEFGYVNSFDPVYFDFESNHDCLFKVYHSVDLIEGEPYIAKHGVQAEINATRFADYVITTSVPLEHRLQKYNHMTKCISNAADFNHFHTSMPEPSEYNSIKGKKLVYTGNLGIRIDYDLIQSLAVDHPDWNIMLVGPEDPTYFKGQHLKKLKNVHFLGAKPFNELPAYIQHADLLFIPFLCNELTHHIYPLKLNEYLASGNPIVTTRFTVLNEFSSLLEITDKTRTIGKACEKAFEENSELLKKMRIEQASKNTWDHRMKDWKLVLEELEVQHH